MAVSLRHIRHQGPVLHALGRTAVEVLRQRVGRPSPEGPVPGPVLIDTVPPRPADLVRAFVASVGGDPRAYAGVVPPHLFPQWTFPILARTLIGVPYPLARALNGGFRLTVRGPLPLDQPLEVTAQLTGIDDNGRRAILHQSVTTGPPSQPDALGIEFYPIVPHGRDAPAEPGASRPRKDKPRVPADGVREIATWRLSPRAGLDFALLTGDFNPIHWIRPAARAAGFKNTILHGFATWARAIEAVNRNVFAGDPTQLTAAEVRFTRPLVLPARVGLYLSDDDDIFVGDAPGGPAYLIAHIVRQGAPESAEPTEPTKPGDSE